MDLYWSVERGRLVNGIRSTVVITDLAFKRRDAAELRLYFIRDDGTIVEQPSTAEIRFAIKRPGEYSSDPLVFTADFVEQADYSWLAKPNLNTTQLNTYFVPPNIAQKTGMAEVTWRPTETAGWNSSQTLGVIIENDVIEGDEGTPTNADEPTDYLTAAQSEARYVRYDEEQTLETAEKTQVRTTIGAAAATHTHTVADLPIATSEQALAGVSDTTLLTPELLTEVLDQYSDALTTEQVVKYGSASKLNDGVNDTPANLATLELGAGVWIVKANAHMTKTVGSNTAARALNIELVAVDAQTFNGSAYTERVGLDILRAAAGATSLVSNCGGSFTTGQTEMIAEITLDDTATVLLRITASVTGTPTGDGSTLAAAAHITATRQPD
jgi:hypothetical protein